MEKSLRDQSVANKADKLKDSSWNRDKNQGYLSGFPWLPRSYTCSFCKREFRSAQALGGHMNVHRRERARLLRHSPPSFLNPNPNFSSSSPYYGPLSSTGSVSTYMKGAKPCFGVKEFNDGCGDKFMKNSKFKMKMMNAIFIRDSDEDLDLELRLGCS